jgi:CHAT domain-containing protein
VANAEQLIADMFTALGDERQAWVHFDRALHLSAQTFNPRRRYTVLAQTALACDRSALYECSVVFRTEALGGDWRRPGTMAFELANRAWARLQLGDNAGAAADLRQSQIERTRVNDPVWNNLIDTAILKAEAAVLRHVQPDLAAARLKDAVNRQVSLGSTIQLAELHLLTGILHRARGDHDEALAEFVTGMDRIDEHRKAVKQPQHRVSYFDHVWSIYEEAIETALRAGQTNEAFRLAIRGRSRLFSESNTATINQLPTPPSNAAILWYVALPERWVAWLVTRDKPLQIFEGAAGRRALADMVRRIERARGDPEAFKRTTAALDREILAPVRPFLARDAVLLIVPDGPLHGTPFAALWSEELRRFLLEERPVGVLSRAPRVVEPYSARRSLSALVVGDPIVTGPLAGTLQRLPGAADEAQQIANRYSRATLLSGGIATRDRFRSAIEHADVVHFAGHALINESQPLMSWLLFSPSASDGPSEPLFSRELLELDLVRRPMVVLAACSTAKGSTFRGEGPLALAWAFLDAGAHSVVATLWDADDRASRTLFVRWHEALLSGQSPVESLRAAQLALLRSASPEESSPRVWANAVYIQ